MIEYVLCQTEMELGGELLRQQVLAALVSLTVCGAFLGILAVIMTL